MAAIDAALIERLQKKLGLSRAAVYNRIQKIVNTVHLERRLAAILLASQRGVNTARFATPEDLAAIRQVMSPGAVAKVSPLRMPGPPPPSKPRRGGPQRRAARQRGTSVWVVHGRNVKAANELRRFLRALGLNPMEWNQAVAKTRQGSPYVGTVLEKAFNEAAGVVVLLTPDDEARLRRRYQKAGEPSHEIRLTPQARPNVLFEAGMAFGCNPNSTVLVQLGRLRPFSDVAGRLVVHLDGSSESRRELATKLKNAGCDVDLSGLDWLSEGDFSQP